MSSSTTIQGTDYIIYYKFLVTFFCSCMAIVWPVDEYMNDEKENAAGETCDEQRVVHLSSGDNKRIYAAALISFFKKCEQKTKNKIKIFNLNLFCRFCLRVSL